MNKRKGMAPERKTFVVIRSGQKRAKVEYATWRYWEIFNELRWLGLGRDAAHKAAQWATGKRSSGEKIIAGLNITMEIVEREG